MAETISGLVLMQKRGEYGRRQKGNSGKKCIGMVVILGKDRGFSLQIPRVTLGREHQELSFGPFFMNEKYNSVLGKGSTGMAAFGRGKVFYHTTPKLVLGREHQWTRADAKEGEYTRRRKGNSGWRLRGMVGASRYGEGLWHANLMSIVWQGISEGVEG